MNGNGNGNGTTIRRDLFFVVALLVQTIALAWLVVVVSEMRGNRFTSADGLAVWKAIGELPPDRFEMRMFRAEQRNQEHEARLRVLEGQREQ